MNYTARTKSFLLDGIKFLLSFFVVFVLEALLTGFLIPGEYEDRMQFIAPLAVALLSVWLSLFLFLFSLNSFCSAIWPSTLQLKKTCLRVMGRSAVTLFLRMEEVVPYSEIGKMIIVRKMKQDTFQPEKLLKVQRKNIPNAGSYIIVFLTKDTEKEIGGDKKLMLTTAYPAFYPKPEDFEGIVSNFMEKGVSVYVQK